MHIATDLITANRLTLTSAWQTMILPFIGMLIVNTLLVWTVGGYFVQKILPMQTFENRHSGLLGLAILVVLTILAWARTYLKYYPSNWKTQVIIDLEEQLITITGEKGTRSFHFSIIEHIRFKAATSMFSTSYLYYVKKIREEEVAMLAVSDNSLSYGLFHFFRDRAKLNTLQ